MMDMVRLATAADIPAMVSLSEQARRAYEAFQPVFWRQAHDSAERQSSYFAALLSRNDVIPLVHVSDGCIHGFLIAHVQVAPPVYNPGGPTCLVDDFTVKWDEEWENVGSHLLHELEFEATERGAAQIVVVCGHADAPKRAFLARHGLTIASEWYTRPLP